MKDFANANARDLKHAVTLAEQAHRAGRGASFAGGGSDLLGLAKERLVAPDVLIYLKTIKGLDRVTKAAGGLDIGGLITLEPSASTPAPPGVRCSGRSGGKRRHTANQKRRHAGGQRLPTSVVLVFQERVSLFQERGEDLFLGHGRKSVPCDFRRRPELHRASIGHGAGPRRARREVPHRGAVGRAARAGRRVLRAATRQFGP